MLEILSERLQNWLLEKKIRTQNADVLTRRSLRLLNRFPGWISYREEGIGFWLRNTNFAAKDNKPDHVVITHAYDRSMVERKFTLITEPLIILRPSKGTHFGFDDLDVGLNDLDEDQLSDDIYSYVFPSYRLYV
jgi:hypothetical protein